MNVHHLLDQLIVHEGLRLKPYRDTAGKLTIGIGRNLEDRGITEAEARYLCLNDIGVVEVDLTRNFPRWLHLSERRQMALADMCFNLGWPRLSQFKRMFAAIEAGDFDAAAAEMLDSLWAKQVGRRAETLARMMREG